MLTHSFYTRRFKKQKKLLELTVFFTLLGSLLKEAAFKMLVKLTPGTWCAEVCGWNRSSSLSADVLTNLVTDEERLETTEPAADRRDNNEALLEP